MLAAKLHLNMFLSGRFVFVPIAILTTMVLMYNLKIASLTRWMPVSRYCSEVTPLGV